MYKIFLTVRNRLSVTTKCLTSIKKHSSIPHQIYIYDNLTNYKIKEHFLYFSMLYENNLIDQICFTSKNSTFNAFSKAVTFNMFGQQHEMDPNKNKFNFLVFLDNDMIVSPDWDKILIDVMNDLNKEKLDHIKIITQKPGGAKIANRNKIKLGEKDCYEAILGGSGFWVTRNNFFSDVGFLDLKRLINHNKKHDQFYWELLRSKNKNKPYTLVVDHPFCYHTGKFSRSICNVLTNKKRDPELLEKIKFEQSEKTINNMSFDEFYNLIINDSETKKW